MWFLLRVRTCFPPATILNLGDKRYSYLFAFKLLSVLSLCNTWGSISELLRSGLHAEVRLEREAGHCAHSKPAEPGLEREDRLQSLDGFLPKNFLRDKPAPKRYFWA